MKKILFCILITFASSVSFAARAKIPYIVNHPYTSILLIDGDSGEVILEENADKKIYPASVIKLMDLLIILEQIEAGKISLEDWVHVTAESARIGGSQVYLKEGETFSLDEMLYALSIKSANDVAVALALHIGGNQANFVRMMNARAAKLGMTSTDFHSVHGLPPDVGEKPDTSTARDLAILSREIVKHPKALHYTSTKEKWFRNNTFEMLTHNRILKDVEGCDGLKTGYITAGGFSVSATAVRNGRRVIAIITGCKSRPTRDDKARELIAYGFSNLPEVKAPEPEPVVEAVVSEEPVKERRSGSFSAGIKHFFLFTGKALLALLALLGSAVVLYLAYYAFRQNRDKWKYKF
jgi:D-alanyl-D-alanine carboxypeptidase (penicillin-binding protein 5/6)